MCPQNWVFLHPQMGVNIQNQISPAELRRQHHIDDSSSDILVIETFWMVKIKILNFLQMSETSGSDSETTTDEEPEYPKLRDKENPFGVSKRINSDRGQRFRTCQRAAIGNYQDELSSELNSLNQIEAKCGTPQVLYLTSATALVSRILTAGADNLMLAGQSRI